MSKRTYQEIKAAIDARIAKNAAAKAEKELTDKKVEPETPEKTEKENVSHETNEPRLFLANITDFSFKDDSASMEAPIFSLSTKEDLKVWEWESSDGRKKVKVIPSILGRATQHDKDILIFCMSQIVAAMNAGITPSRTVQFKAYDYFKATNRNTRGDDYTRFKQALDRLAGTRVTTETKVGTRKQFRQAEGFGLISRWSVVEKADDDKTMVAVQVKLSEWLYEQIENMEVLTINPDYFGLRKSLDRRLYEIARKHVGKQASFSMKLETLRDKCGSTTGFLKSFRLEIRKSIEADAIPDYRMELLEGDIVRFTPKNQPVDKLR